MHKCNMSMQAPQPPFIGAIFPYNCTYLTIRVSKFLLFVRKKNKEQ